MSINNYKHINVSNYSFIFFKLLFNLNEIIYCMKKFILNDVTKIEKLMILDENFYWSKPVCSDGIFIETAVWQDEVFDQSERIKPYHRDMSGMALY